MRDTFAFYAPGLTSPGGSHYTITPGPGDLPFRPRAIRCDIAGTATLVDSNGTSVTYNLAAGEVIMFRAVKVTSATATLIAWY